MKRRAWITLTVVVAGALLSYFGWPYAFTIMPIQEVEAVEQSEVFDPVAYVDGVWASQIQPTIVEKAVDLAVILEAIEPDAGGRLSGPAHALLDQGRL